MKRPAAKTERPRALETTHPPAVPCQAMRGWGALGGPVASQVAEAVCVTSVAQSLHLLRLELQRPGMVGRYAVLL